ncbi:arginine decarboxylase [Musa troglodytarum]|uniref:Arginine decarboxylase n=1 Tax=Musa troglodytarum TaxID=320322 RepID=A0A9E7I950_9LILI|nr:arginine decarboxylase [Musa troglodytarum]
MAAAYRGEDETCAVYANQLKQRCIDYFKDGVLSLEYLAAVDGICDLVAEELGGADPVNIPYQPLALRLDARFLGDRTAVPGRPDSPPRPAAGSQGILSDLTCDSDGKVDRFIGGQSSLPLHEIKGSILPGDVSRRGVPGGARRAAQSLRGAERCAGGPERRAALLRGDAGGARPVVRGRPSSDAA